MAINDLGMVRPGSTILIPWATYDSANPSASSAMTGLALADIGIYKDLSMTERASTTGVVLLDTDGIDIDGAVGIGGFSVDLSSNATAGFYSAGSKYYVTIASVTVDAATVNAVVATFEIGYPNALVNTTVATYASQTSFTLTAGAAEADVYNGWQCIIHDVASDVQMCIGYISDYAVTTKTVTLVADPGFTFAATDNISLIPPANVYKVAGTIQTAGDIPALVVTADGAIDTLATTVGTAGDGLTAIPATVDWLEGGRLDLLLDAILLDTGTTLDNLIDNEVGDIKTVVDAIQVVTDKFAFTVANQVDSNALQVEGVDATDAINAACDAALDTAIAELSQGAPTATPTVRTALMLMYMALRNRLDVNTSGTDELAIYNNAGTKIVKKLITDDGSDYSEAEAISGA